MIARSPAIPGASTRARPSTIRSGGFYAGRRAFSELSSVLFGVVILIWTLLPLYHMVMLSLTPLSDSFAARFWPRWYMTTVWSVSRTKLSTSPGRKPAFSI